MKWIAALLVSWVAVASAAAAGPIPVTIERIDGNYQLLRGGKPYQVRGAGTQLVEDLESLARHGGNSVRTWSTDNAGEMLDRAQELGLTVSLCLDIKRERHGFDYDDENAVRRQLEFARGEVLRYRDHPALLTWIIGNELNLESRNPKVYDAVNDISKMIHELDPHHPTTTTTAGLSMQLAKRIRKRAPDLDFLSVQLYGGLFGFTEALREIHHRGPMMITEWGTSGHWEVPTTRWDAPIEMTSTEKAEAYIKGFVEEIHTLDERLIGNYVFLWSYKLERTPTWYSMFTQDGLRTEVVDVMQRIWTGAWPANRAPRVEQLRFAHTGSSSNVRLRAGDEYQVEVSALDPENRPLRYEWRLSRESDATEIGGDAEAVPEDLTARLAGSDRPAVKFSTPEDAGAYRLFVYVYDDAGGVAHANVPFFVKAGRRSGK